MLNRFIANCIALLIYAVFVSPSKLTVNVDQSTAYPSTLSLAKENVQPQLITIEDFESLLRSAGDIFQTSNSFRSTLHSSQMPVPYQHIQPPSEPYNFYTPTFGEHENIKLDEKSKQMEKILPPPIPDKTERESNYYTLKPRKLPKKFDASAKHTNMKWLNTFEREANYGRNSPVYLVNDETNRINFDDTFFAVDMQVRMLDNEPHKSTYDDNGKSSFIQGKEMSDEDLIAVPTLQMQEIYNSRSK